MTANELRFVLRLVLAFFASYAALFLLDWAAPAVFLPLKVFVANSEALLLPAAGIPAFAYGPLVRAGSWSFTIVLECTGAVLLALLLSLFYASRLGTRKTLAFLAFYAPFLALFNIARLFATIYSAAAYGRAAFEATHLFLWLFDSFVVLLLWARATGFSLSKRP